VIGATVKANEQRAQAVCGPPGETFVTLDSESFGNPGQAIVG
jgi:hypothetical protein